MCVVVDGYWLRGFSGHGDLGRCLKDVKVGVTLSESEGTCLQPGQPGPQHYTPYSTDMNSILFVDTTTTATSE